MRARRLIALALAGAVAACTHNPDPREPSVEMMQKRAFGGWIVVAQRAGTVHAGELISADSGLIRVLGPRGMSVIPIHTISSATLYEYEHEGGLGAWGLLGGLSTISHGFVLIISFPIWMLVTGITAGAESRHVIIEYPKRSWGAISKWARFPQGMPPGLDPRALVTPRSAMPPPSPVSPPVSPPVMPPPAPPATTTPPTKPPTPPPPTTPAKPTPKTATPPPVWPPAPPSPPSPPPAPPRR